jgi:hypothetical protein
LREAIIMVSEFYLTGTAGVGWSCFGLCTAKYIVAGCRRDFSGLAILVPRQAVLASVDNLKARRSNIGADLGQDCVSGVDSGHLIARGPAEGRQDLAIVGPSHDKQRLGHLTSGAMRKTAPSGLVGACACTFLQRRGY